MKKFGLGFVMLAFVIGMSVIGPATVSAALTSAGEGTITGSWAQRFNESGVGQFNTMEFFMISGPAFATDAPAFSGATDSSWKGSQPNPMYLLATGNTTSDLTFNLDFSGSQITPFAFDFFAYNGGVGTIPVDEAKAAWNGSGWTFTSISPDSSAGMDRNSVPEPSILLLLGMGVFGAGLYGRGLRKKKS